MAAKSLYDDAVHWRGRAGQMRLVAEGIEDPKAREIMLRIAKDYDKLAERADLRVDGRGGLDGPVRLFGPIGA